MTDDGKIDYGTIHHGESSHHGGSSKTGSAAVAPHPPYLWQVPGKPVSVELDIDNVDRLSQEIMRGFGVVPRRGVEMGGILLGSVQATPTGHRVVVEDFEPVPCQHAQGTSWLLSGEEQVLFEDTLARWAPAEGKRTYAVGFYRSHTREGLGMTAEDQSMFHQYFRDPASIVLLVKPFATRTGVAGIFFREATALKSDASYLEFPFHPRELSGESPALVSPAQSSPGPEANFTAPVPGSHRAERHGITELNLAAPLNSPAIKNLRTASQSPRNPKGGLNMATASNSLMQDSFTSDQLSFGIPTATRDVVSGQRRKTGWVWIPLSFVFVLVGLVLGMLITASVGMRLPVASSSQNPYSLGMSAAPSGQGLLLRWDRSSPAIEKTTGGQLLIRDGGAEKTVPLDPLQLRNGSVIYRNASPDVTFRLEVQTIGNATLSETVRFRK